MLYCSLQYVQIEYFTVKYGNTKTLLGINIKAKLKFHVLVGIIGQKANRKLNALAKIANYMELRKNGILMNAFFTIQFNYCPAIWMCHSRSLNNKINGFLERCQRIIHNHEFLNFEELLNKNNSVSNHYKNLRALAIQISKLADGFSPEITNEIFKLRTIA